MSRAARLAAVLTLLRVPAGAVWPTMARPEAAIELRAEDDEIRQRSGGASATSRQRLFQERLRLDTRGDVYDERFMTYSLGLGVNMAQTRLSGGQEQSARSFDDEYRGQLSLFPKHEISGALFGERGTSTPHNVFSGRTRFERRHLRGALNLKRPSLPSSVSYWDSQMSGGGVGAPFNQRSSGFQLLGAVRPEGPFAADFRHTYERFADSLGVGYRYNASSLGASYKPTKRQVLTTQGRFEERRGSLRMRVATVDSGWDFAGKTLRANSRLGFERKDVETQRTSRQSAGGRLEHRLYDSLTSGAAGDLEWNRDAASRSRSQRVQLSEDYVKRLWGPIRLGAHYDESRRWSESRFASRLSNVLDEPHELRDGVSEFLAQLSVNPDTVVVLNEDRLRRYRRGADYELVARGQLTEVQRLVTGSIVNGEKVLVSYQHSASGRRRTEDASRGLRFSLLLGSRGSFWVSEARNSQRVLEAETGSGRPNAEAVRERGWGSELRWRLFAASQSWRVRDSDIAPLRAFRSNIRVGGLVTPRLTAMLGWNYDSSRFLATGAQNLGREYFVEGRLAPSKRLEFALDGRMGETSAGGLAGLYRSIEGRLNWTHRSLEVEARDRFTWRRIGDSSAQENLVQVRIVRRL